MAESDSVHLIDDRALFRDALRGLLEQDGVRVAGESDSHQSAIAEVGTSDPDAVICEASWRDGDGTSLIRSLATTYPGLRIVVYTGAADAATVIACLRAGASAYVLKDDDIGELLAAIRAVRGGGAYTSPSITRALVDVIRRGAAPAADLGGRVSDREVQVLQLLALGLDNNQIAERLGISSRTAKNHVSHILEKLELDNRVQAAVFAVRSGLADA